MAGRMRVSGKVALTGPVPDRCVGSTGLPRAGSRVGGMPPAKCRVRHFRPARFGFETGADKCRLPDQRAGLRRRVPQWADGAMPYPSLGRLNVHTDTSSEGQEPDERN